jgi:hypothetical protein
MSARRNDPRRKETPAWHAKLLAMLPTIIRYTKRAFRGYDPEARQEAVQNVVANTTAAVAGLAKRGKLDLAYPTVLAKFGIRQTLDNRKTGSSQNIKDVLSKYCQENKGVMVERLDKFNEQEDCWKEAVVQDTRSLPVPEVVAFRVDFKDWLKSLHPRDRKVVRFLSLGHRTADAARRFKVTPSRIAHLRRELAESWRRFVGDEGEGAAAAA